MKLGIAALTMLIANLLIPQQVVIRPHCCYDSHGNLRPCAMAASASSDQLVIRDEGCCKIRHVTLKLPLPALSGTGKQQALGSACAFIAPAPLRLLDFGETACAQPSGSGHGPPGAVSILQSHSRLNL